MGLDEDKAEKKRLKTQYKLEKKRMKMKAEAGLNDAEHIDKSPKKTAHAKKTIEQTKSQDSITNADSGTKQAMVLWYKNPEWVRALVATASLVVAVIAIVLTFR
jgi:hypothetical protein